MIFFAGFRYTCLAILQEIDWGIQLKRNTFLQNKDFVSLSSHEFINLREGTWEWKPNINPYAGGGLFCKYKIMQKLKKWQALAHGYSSVSTKWELSNEYQHDRGQMVFKNLGMLVLWTKVTLAFWGLFTYIGVFETWPHKKDVHHFWSLHPPWRYAPGVGLKHDTDGNFLALGLT